MTETKSYKAYLIADGVRCHLLFGIVGSETFSFEKETGNLVIYVNERKKMSAFGTNC